MTSTSNIAPKTPSMTLGAYIKRRRKQLRLTQHDLNVLLGQYYKTYGDSTIGYWETDRGMPPIKDPEFIQALASALKVSKAEILQIAGLIQDPPADLPPIVVEGYRNATPEDRELIDLFFESIAAKNKRKSDQQG